MNSKKLIGSHKMRWDGDAVNYEHLGGDNDFKNLFAMWWRYELTMEQTVLIVCVFKWILGKHYFKNVLICCLYDVDMAT